MMTDWQATTFEQPPTSTPWGRYDSCDRIAEGIYFVTTPSHGGFWLSDARMVEMPEAFKSRTFVKPPRGEAGRWYEEDCDAAMVVVAFRQHFEAEAVSRALKAVNAWLTASVQFWAQDDEGRHRDDAEVQRCRDDLTKALKELEGVA